MQWTQHSVICPSRLRIEEALKSKWHFEKGRLVLICVFIFFPFPELNCIFIFFSLTEIGKLPGYYLLSSFEIWGNLGQGTPATLRQAQMIPQGVCSPSPTLLLGWDLNFGSNVLSSLHSFIMGRLQIPEAQGRSWVLYLSVPCSVPHTVSYSRTGVWEVQAGLNSSKGRGMRTRAVSQEGFTLT